MADIIKKIGRPLRNGSNLNAARQAILNGCSMYETARLSGISMYTFRRLRKELYNTCADLGDVAEEDCRHGGAAVTDVPRRGKA
jgi:hypothetical protein